MTLTNTNIYLLSLGCAKNLVDSEMLSGIIRLQGCFLTDDPREAQIIIINTCGFIRAAQEESIATILDAASYKDKEHGSCQLLIVVGCLVEKNRPELAKAIPEIDLFLGTHEYQRIGELIAAYLNQSPQVLPVNAYLLRELATPPATAYLKIAEGCDNWCSYCLIPQLRGRLTSRKPDEIIEEAHELLKRGVKELVIIAQDTTAYGKDFDGTSHLAELLDQLASMPFTWLRLLYVYPAEIDQQLLEVMSAHDNICHYLDIPLQHADDQILLAMNRRDNQQQIREKIDMIRRYLPDVALRTTMMVGFPGEQETHFRRLLRFVADIRFDWLGAFCFSRQDDTVASLLPHQVREATKQRRLKQLMELAATISTAHQNSYIGRSQQILCEGSAADELGESWYKGRSFYQAPDVDGLVYFKANNPIAAGMFVDVKITAADTYDLIGELI